MKTITAVLLASAAFTAAGPALAGRDETQVIQHWRVVEAKKAAALAQAKQESSGLAGPTGVSGKTGPGTPPARVRKDPTAHP